MCPRERLVILSNTTGLSFAKERIGPLAAFIIIVFYLITLYLSTLSKNPKNLFAKYLQRIPAPSHSSTPYAPRWVRHSYLSKILRYTPILVGHQDYFLAPLPGSEALLESGTGKGNFYCEYCLLLLVALFSLWIIR